MIVLLLGMLGVCSGGALCPEPRLRPPSETESFELAPGIVVDRRLPMIYLMAPSGGIRAVDPRSGEVIWSSDAADKPLLVVGGRLVAQAETGAPTPGVLTLVFLNAENGGKPLLRIDAPIPPGVLPLVDQRLGASFSLRAWEEGETVVMAWDYLEKHVAGVAPPPGAPPFRKQESGVFSIDEKTGKITPLADAAGPTMRALPESIQRLVDAGELRQAPWLSGEVLSVAVEKNGNGGGRRVVLRRWQAETGTLLPDVVLIDGPTVARAPSADRRHLMISGMLSVRGAGGERYLWSVFSLTTGKKLGAVRRSYSAPPFCVLGGLLVHRSLPFGRRIDDEWVDEPMKLRAIDLVSGGEIWSRAIRDTAFRGSPPPGS